MKIIKGDLLRLALTKEVTHIVHGCNCFHAMGSGIAGLLAKQFPEIPAADRDTKSGDIKKLASYSRAYVTYQEGKKGGPLKDSEHSVLFDITHPFHCINLYTQYAPGADFLPSLFPEALKLLNKDFKGRTLHFPMIGCGIGGGDWATVMSDMLKYLKDVNVVVVIL
jgi:O-acetyl-ADP-ribose deacetylase (regulator of RNase III)